MHVHIMRCINACTRICMYVYVSVYRCCCLSLSTGVAASTPAQPPPACLTPSCMPTSPSQPPPDQPLLPVLSISSLDPRFDPSIRRAIIRFIWYWPIRSRRPPPYMVLIPSLYGFYLVSATSIDPAPRCGCWCWSSAAYTLLMDMNDYEDHILYVYIHLFRYRYPWSIRVIFVICDIIHKAFVILFAIYFYIRPTCKLVC